jgi:hypothetical protein
LFDLKSSSPYTKAKGYGTTRHGGHLTKTSEGTTSTEEVKEARGKEPHEIK